MLKPTLSRDSVTGETTLAPHPASEKNPAGKVELGFTVADVEAFYRDTSAKGVLFSMPPKNQDFGGCLRSSSIPKAQIAAWAQRRHSSRCRELRHQARYCMRRIESIVSCIENGFILHSPHPFSLCMRCSFYGSFSVLC
jgi:hypothetical protein